VLSWDSIEAGYHLYLHKVRRFLMSDTDGLINENTKDEAKAALWFKRILCTLCNDIVG
jgi:hypothetical protein